MLFYFFVFFVFFFFFQAEDGIRVPCVTGVQTCALPIYTLTGAKVTSLQRGVNIVRTADGRTLKVLKK